MTLPDTSAVETALTAVAEAQAELDRAKYTLADRTDALEHALALLALDLDMDQAPDPALIDRLYWDAPSLSTEVVASTFRLRHRSEVSRYVKPREFHVQCRDCGTGRIFPAKTRTELAGHRGSRCVDCAAEVAERDRLRAVEVEAERRRRHRDDAAHLHAAMVAYVLAHPDLPEEPAGETFYVDIHVPQWGNSTVKLGDLNGVRRELDDRSRRAL